MVHRVSRVLVMLLAGAAMSAAPASTTPGDSNPLTVHEWGTFTSIAGADGAAVEWTPLAGPSDLPCFVERSRFNLKGALSGTVRMETPVLYFYAARETTVSVSVRFRDGVITEWFPPAANPPDYHGLVPGSESAIAWRNIKVSPGAPELFPTEQSASHYYAARRTDAAPLHAGSVSEKFLFYRGVGRFALPIAATVDAGGNVAVRNLVGQRAGDIILFTNHDGRMTYEVRRADEGPVVVDPPVTDVEPAFELERMLLATGLYQAEATAMIDTWRDSWFEEGTRLFYVVPRRTIDGILPLSVSPAPAVIARAFVGRMELLTPATERAIRDALLANDLDALRPYARFLHAIGQRIVADSGPADRAQLERRLHDVSAVLMTPERACAQ